MDTEPVEAPTLASAHDALRRLYGPHSEDVWLTLLFNAGLTGTETGLSAFGRMAVSMRAAGGITEMCGRALALRAEEFKRQTEKTDSDDRAERHRFVHRPDDSNAP